MGGHEICGVQQQGIELERGSGGDELAKTAGGKLQSSCWFD